MYPKASMTLHLQKQQSRDKSSPHKQFFSSKQHLQEGESVTGFAQSVYSKKINDSSTRKNLQALNKKDSLNFGTNFGNMN